MTLFDFSKNKLIKSWKGHEKDITKTLYCSKLDKYVSASRDKSIKLWNLKNDAPDLVLNGHELVVTAIATDSG